MTNLAGSQSPRSRRKQLLLRQSSSELYSIVLIAGKIVQVQWGTESAWFDYPSPAADELSMFFSYCYWIFEPSTWKVPADFCITRNKIFHKSLV